MESKQIQEKPRKTVTFKENGVTVYYCDRYIDDTSDESEDVQKECLKEGNSKEPQRDNIDDKNATNNCSGNSTKRNTRASTSKGPPPLPSVNRFPKNQIRKRRRSQRLKNQRKRK